jgi:hypothetical protein
MANRVTIRKEEDTSWERHLFAETSPEYKGYTFIGVNAIGHRLEVALNQKELAEFISELQKFINPTHNA